VKRLTLNLSPTLVVEDDADALDIQHRIGDAILKLEGVETVIYRRMEVTEARQGTCKVGPHTFFVDGYFPADKPVPDICRNHWYDEQVSASNAEHAPLFEAVEALTGLGGYIWQSGGMTMTMKFPLPDSATEGEQEGYPAYLGLKEDETEDGRWTGSVGFYPTWEGEDCVQVFEAYDEPKTPQEWAEAIAAHYETVKQPA
jgi:hypothetical protein